MSGIEYNHLVELYKVVLQNEVSHANTPKQLQVDPIMYWGRM